MTDVPQVYIRWYDHWSPTETSWMLVEDFLEAETEPLECYSTGFLLKETEKMYFVANSITASGQCIGLMGILKSDVKEIKYLKVPR